MRSEGSVGWRLPLISVGMLQKPLWLAESCGGLLDSGFAVGRTLAPCSRRVWRECMVPRAPSPRAVPVWRMDGKDRLKPRTLFHMGSQTTLNIATNPTLVQILGIHSSE